MTTPDRDGLTATVARGIHVLNEPLLVGQELILVGERPSFGREMARQDLRVAHQTLGSAIRLLDKEEQP